jgi:hypothetical protein
MPDATYIHAEVPAVDHTPEVEQRLRRLEASVAAMQDTQLMEERVAERVVVRLKRSPLKALRESAGLVVEAGRSLAPVEPVVERPAAPTGTENALWLLPDLWSELRTFGRMLFDHRYAFSITGRFGPAVIVCTYVFVWFFIGGITLVGGFVERAIDIVLAVLLYKIIAREVRRYRRMFPDAGRL